MDACFLANFMAATGQGCSIIMFYKSDTHTPSFASVPELQKKTLAPLLVNDGFLDDEFHHATASSTVSISSLVSVEFRPQPVPVQVKHVTSRSARDPACSFAYKLLR